MSYFKKFSATAVVGLLALASSAPVHAVAITWDGSVSNLWFTAGNWDTNTVPGAGDSAFVNNGGTAEASGGTGAAPWRLYVGADDPATIPSGARIGTVNATGVDISTAFFTRVGVASEDITSATGAIGITGGNLDLPGGILTVGAVENSTTASQANALGTVTVDGSVDTSSSSRIGYLFNGDGAATGTLTATNGIFGNFSVGTSGSAAATGTAMGSMVVSGGDLELKGQTFRVGDNFGDATVNGSVDVVAGTLRTASIGFDNNIVVGRAFGGMATGNVTSVQIDTTDLSLNDVTVGSAANGGTAVGEFYPGTGNVSMLGDFRVGRVSLQVDGNATGTVVIGGSVNGAGGQFQVGTGQGFGLFDSGLGTSDGNVTVSGVSGFDRYDVGYLAGTAQQNTASATGTLSVGNGGITGFSDTSSLLRVGVTNGTPNNAQIFGPGGDGIAVTTVNQGDISGIKDIFVGHGFNFGDANGSLTLTDGNYTGSGSILVGTTTAQPSSVVTALEAELTATGLFEMSNGALNLTGYGNINIGTASTRGDATGTMNLTNVDVSADGAPLGSSIVGGAVFVGSAFNGSEPNPVSGNGQLNMIGGSLNVRSLGIGLGGDGNTAQGAVSFDGTVVHVDTTITVGAGAGHGVLTAVNSTVSTGENFWIQNFGSFFDPGSGAASFVNSSLSVGESATIGPTYQPGTGSLSLLNSTMDVAGNLRIGLHSNYPDLFGETTVVVDRSYIQVAGDLKVDIGASLQFVLGGTGRGTEYGAMDVHSAPPQFPTPGGIDGHLVVTFDFLPLVDAFDFDLIVTELFDGITGDFRSVNILGLDPMFGVTYGIVTDWVNNELVEIYRVSIYKAPEPGTLAIFVIGLVGLGMLRRGRG